MLFSLTQTATPQRPDAFPIDPSAFIQKLYTEVIHYQPLGILEYEYVGHPTRKIVTGDGARRRFLPLLSKPLQQRIAAYNACLRDWDRRYRGQNLKGPIFEGGIFSGGDEFSGPERFQLEEMQSQPDGSLHAFVQLSGRIDPPQWLSWRVEVILVHEESHLVVNDVIYLHGKDGPRDDEHLSEIVPSVCTRK